MLDYVGIVLNIIDIYACKQSINRILLDIMLYGSLIMYILEVFLRKNKHNLIIKPS